jgi:hypothetical protein
MLKTKYMTYIKIRFLLYTSIIKVLYRCIQALDNSDYITVIVLCNNIFLFRSLPIIYNPKVNKVVYNFC